MRFFHVKAIIRLCKNCWFRKRLVAKNQGYIFLGLRPKSMGNCSKNLGPLTKEFWWENCQIKHQNSSLIQSKHKIWDNVFHNTGEVVPPNPEKAWGKLCVGISNWKLINDGVERNFWSSTLLNQGRWNLFKEN